MPDVCLSIIYRRWSGQRKACRQSTLCLGLILVLPASAALSFSIPLWAKWKSHFLGIGPVYNLPCPLPKSIQTKGCQRSPLQWQPSLGICKLKYRKGNINAPYGRRRDLTNSLLKERRWHPFQSPPFKSSYQGPQQLLHKHISCVGDFQFLNGLTVTQQQAGIAEGSPLGCVEEAGSMATGRSCLL